MLRAHDTEPRARVLQLAQPPPDIPPTVQKAVRCGTTCFMSGDNVRKQVPSSVRRRGRSASAVKADRQSGLSFAAVALATLIEASILLSGELSEEVHARRLSPKRPVARDKIPFEEVGVRKKKLAARK